MIKVTVNGEDKYRLYFKRETYSHLKNKQPLYETTAIVTLAGAKRDDAPVARASARQYHKDRYSPESARRAALKALLQPGRDIADAFNREERGAIWQAYWNRNAAQKRAPAPVPPTPVAARLSAPAPAAKPVAKSPDGFAVVSRVLPFIRRDAVYIDQMSDTVH